MIRVLVVDDDFRVAGIHAEFTEQVSGFSVAGIANSAAQARSLIPQARPDLLLLDVYLPDDSGLSLLRQFDIDAFALSAADDPATISSALRAGALQYLIKPFSAQELSGRLLAYRTFRAQLTGEHLTQQLLDQTLRGLHGKPTPGTARQSPATTKLIREVLRSAEQPLSAAEIARELGMARATAQRHLGALADEGAVHMALRYGSTGRPEHEYRLAD